MSNEAEIRKRKIYHVTFVGLVVNLVLSLLKLAAGIVGRSGAMVADAVHSFSDLATDVVVIAFARISAKPRDSGHDYGHGKYETLATIIISLALGIVGAGILFNSIEGIRVVVEGGSLPRPGAVALIAALVSILVKEILYRYTVAGGSCAPEPECRGQRLAPPQRRPFVARDAGRNRLRLLPRSKMADRPIPLRPWSWRSSSSRSPSTSSARA